MRDLKVNETPILTGYQLFHNYIRTHESLDVITPAEMCGITVEEKKQVVNPHSEGSTEK